MKKFTFLKIFSVTVLFVFGFGGFAQEVVYPQVGLTMIPSEANPNEQISLVLDVLASCPDSSLLSVDSVMMHSGVTVNETAWSSTVEFNGAGANGQKPKLIPFSPGAQVGNITQTPVTVYDQVNVVVWPNWTCPAGALIGADSVMMHSGLEINGQSWQKVVAFDGVGANGMRPKMIPITNPFNGESGWMFSFIPADFYGGLTENDTVTAINCVFNNGSWDAEGKDFGHDGECADFRLQFSNGTPYKYSITLVPNDFYPIADGDVITAINCVFNGGAWDGHEGKAHVVDSEDCEDFMVPMGYTGIWSNKAESTYSLYPNPVNDVLNIGDISSVSKIEIIDVTGKTVYSKEVNAPNISINTSNLSKGIYIVSFQNNKGVQTAKFVKN
jgi:hypothetical protein